MKLCMPALVLWLAASSSLAQTYCPPPVCGPGLGVGAGVQIGRIQIGAGAGVQRIGSRPRTESLASDLMVEVDGGLGVYLGGGLVLTCSHGTKTTVRHQGREYAATVLAEVLPEQGDVAVVHVNLHLPRGANVASRNPPPGTQVQWQGGHGVISGYSGPMMWIRGACRFGDSGSPVWTREAVVGVISGTTGDGEVVAASAAVIHRTVLQARGQLRSPEPAPRLQDAGTEPLEPLPRPAEPTPAPKPIPQPPLTDIADTDTADTDDERVASSTEPPGVSAPRDEPPAILSSLAGLAVSTATGVGLGAGTLGGGWAAWLAMAAALRRLRKRKDSVPDSQLTPGKPDHEPAAVDRLRELLIDCREERTRLESQNTELRSRIADMEQQHRQHVVAYTDTYRQAVQLAEDSLHRKDPERWRQFIPAWRAMVDQFHSAVREEKRHASHSSVH